jgi:hypothetical protein
LKEVARLYRDEGKHGQAALSYFRYLTCPMKVSISADAIDALIQHDKIAEQTRKDAGEQNPAVSDFQHPVFDIHPDYLDEIELDPEKAEAILFLAQFCKECGFLATASQYCSRLLEYGGQESANAKAILREMRYSSDGSMKKRGTVYDTVVVGPIGLMEISPVLHNGEARLVYTDETSSLEFHRLDGMLDD